MKDINKVFSLGNYIRKKNWIPFENKYPYIKVESYRAWANDFLIINEKFQLHPDHVVLLSSDEVQDLDRIWDSCTVQVHVPVPGRNPCLRDDLITPKQVVPESAVQAKLFELRMKHANFQFEAYTCPQCQKIHIGKNPYKEK